MSISRYPSTSRYRSSSTTTPSGSNLPSRAFPIDGRAETQAQDDEEYYMRHKRRGVAIIFSHAEFPDIDGLVKREGTEVDVAALKTQLTRLGFDVKINRDFTTDGLDTALKQESKKDHSDADCLVVVVMSHGMPDLIFAKDGAYSEDTLWKWFTKSNCRSLAGKPKLFFIQACRGELKDSGVDVTDAVVVKKSSKPTEADILVAYATVKGYLAWRNPSKGSWYIEALCKELKTNGKKHDLLRILTCVNRRVAMEYVSQATEVAYNNKRQMPAITSLLTKLVYFR